MLIGIDFDNTLVSYDRLFHRLASEQGLVPADLPANKVVIRDYLRACGREPAWTALQGIAYGARMAEAEPFSGALAALQNLSSAGHQLRIISHKTRAPISGPGWDLHEAARGWLDARGFWAPGTGLQKRDVFFEPTKEAKWARIAAEGCEVFIDDLPEILTSPAFPAGVSKMLFDPEGVHGPVANVTVLRGWEHLSLP
jgi:hypothetical protein